MASASSWSGSSAIDCRYGSQSVRDRAALRDHGTAESLHAGPFKDKDLAPTGDIYYAVSKAVLETALSKVKMSDSPTS